MFLASFVEKSYLTLKYLTAIMLLTFNLQDDLVSTKYYHKWIFQTKSHEKEVLHMSRTLFVKNRIFAYLTFKLTF